MSQGDANLSLWCVEEVMSIFTRYTDQKEYVSPQKEKVWMLMARVIPPHRMPVITMALRRFVGGSLAHDGILSGV